MSPSPPTERIVTSEGLQGPLFFERFRLLGEDVLLSAVYHLARARSISTCLVGGMVRNVFLNEELPHDYDFLCEGDTAELARDVGRALEGSAFILDKNNGLYRVVLKRSGGLITMDFLPLRFPRLEDDLLQRDFTVNAMAISLEAIFKGGHAPALIDPLGGVLDCRKKVLRVVSAGALAQDPLRCLRALRLRHRYALTIEGKTLGQIRKHAHLIEQKPVSWERIRDELSLIFTAPRTAEAVTELFELGLMDVVMPRLKTMAKSGLIHITPAVFNTIDEAEKLTGEIDAGSFPCRPFELSLYFKGNRTMPRALLTLKLTAFFYDIFADSLSLFSDKVPSSACVASDRAATLTLILKELRFGNKTVRAVAGVFRALSRFFNIPAAICERPVVMALFFHKLIEEAGPVAPVFLSLALAVARSGKDAAFAQRLDPLMSMIEYYFGTYVSSPPPPLFTGEEIINTFNLREGERVGALKAMMEEALFTGLVRDKAECSAYMKKRIYERWG